MSLHCFRNGTSWRINCSKVLRKGVSDVPDRRQLTFREPIAGDLTERMR